MLLRKERCDGAATREALLCAAETEFSEKGFDMASTREICRRAGVNVALVNRYFGTKEDLYRLVAQRLFGNLGAPLTLLAERVVDSDSWQAAIREWVFDFLFMTIPTARVQKLCAGLFRHEVTHPTKFHVEFERDFGKPIYMALWNLIAFAEKDPVKLELLTSSVWSQVAIYALVDASWHKSFRPKGTSDAEWRERVGEFICTNLFERLNYG